MPKAKDVRNRTAVHNESRNRNVSGRKRRRCKIFADLSKRHDGQMNEVKYRIHWTYS